MIEVTTIKYLTAAVDVPVYAERPEDPDDTYLIVECTGRSETNYIATAIITVQCYAPSLLAAASLCDRVVKAMRSMIVLDEVCKVSLNSAYNFTNVSTREYRYQAVFDLVYYD